MTLTKYKQKRKFTNTPEPQGGVSDKKKLRFVVQKHAASHLHYDFRLEMGGVLVSWAVPKGPSMDPALKHLAMAVEDHPLDYGNFEGIIPKGNYGGGTVMIWDEGYYTPFEAEKVNIKKDEQDKDLRHQLHAGKIKFTLYGKKLKGGFALIKAKGRGDNAWLIMKMKDKYSSTKDILKKDKSVVSEKSMDEIASAPIQVYKQTKSTPKKIITDAIVKTKKKLPAEATKSASKKVKIPKSFSPMLATLVDKPPVSDDWAYEIKWDGYRAIALLNGDVDLRSRNDKSFNEKFYPIYNELRKLNLNAILDGEIVVINDKGISEFGALQNWRSEADGSLIYYLFDITWLNGKDLTSMPFSKRREILHQNMPSSPKIRLSETFDASGQEFFKLAQKMDLEGIIAKKKNSQYQPGARTSEWLKIKTNKRQEVVIGGFTKNENSDKLFSALLVGVYDKKKLVYTGKIGTGFTEERQREMMSLFKPLITKNPPFESIPDINKPSRFRPNPPHAVATWLKPSMICEVSFTEMTSDGVMRHPSFEGMRSDKKASSVVFEKEKTIDLIETPSKLQKKKILVASGKNERSSLLNPTEETQVKEVNGHSIKFTNLSKVYWPDDGVTKRDMLNYYYQVAPYILPYLKGRPQSLNRFPNGINGKSFYQKDVTGKVPEWIETYQYHSSDSPEDKNFMVASDEASVLYMASLGCIELNPWSSRTNNPDNPDWCIIDLDPGKNSFDQVIEAAQVTKAVLDEMKIPSYPKTSGSTGLHIYIPLGGKYSYEQSKEFARVIVTLVNRRIPKFTSIERMVSNRDGKMYLDFLQNRPKATLACAYSLRPKPGATISMPLDWSEVQKGLTMKHFTIFNSVERIKSNGDIFKPVLGKGINLKKIIQDLSLQKK